MLRKARIVCGNGDTRLGEWFKVQSFSQHGKGGFHGDVSIPAGGSKGAGVSKMSS